MKETKIKDILNFQDLQKLTFELFDNIKLAYALPDYKPEFANYFINIVKKSFSNCTFQQFETAFEYNSIGSLNNDKVRFNIQDLTNVIKAFIKLKNIELSEKQETFEKSPEEIKQIHQVWIRQLNDVFEKYMNSFEKTEIIIPMYTAEYLSKIGLIDANKISYSEPKVYNKFVRKTKLVSKNEDLIYKCFDEILQGGQTLDNFLI